MSRLFPVTVFCVLLAATAAAQTPPPASEGPVIVTTGEGSVKRAPDRAWVQMSAESRAQESARGAEAERRRDDGGARRSSRPPASPATPSRPPATTCSRSSTTTTASRRCAATWRATRRGAGRRPARSSARFSTRRRRRRDVGRRRPLRPQGPQRRRTRSAAACGRGRAAPRQRRGAGAGMNVDRDRADRGAAHTVNAAAAADDGDARRNGAGAARPPIVAGELEMRASVTLTARDPLNQPSEFVLRFRDHDRRSRDRHSRRRSSSNSPTSSGAPSGRAVWSIGCRARAAPRARVMPLSFRRRAVTSTRLSSDADRAVVGVDRLASARARPPRSARPSRGCDRRAAGRAR